MKNLLSEEKLIWSPIVANSTMNRERNASGVNSYEQEIGFKPEVFLEKCIQRQAKVSWLDIACGQAKALIQSALYLEKKDLQSQARLEGIDLVDFFASVPNQINCINLGVKSIFNWQSQTRYDLITCIHGLHYMGDKLKALEIIINHLNERGVFIANLDLSSIHIKDSTYAESVLPILKLHNILYDERKKLISCAGGHKITFDLEYLGADDQAGPNYTGQDVVNSYYEKNNIFK